MSGEPPWMDEPRQINRGRQTQGRGSQGGRGRTFAKRERGEYVEVADRIKMFYEKYPDGALVTTRVRLTDKPDGVPRVMVSAAAFRSPEDEHPGIGTSWMVLPGKTPYTNGSELENTETSAWGRAIAALGIGTNEGIASAQEVRNKRDHDEEPEESHDEAGSGDASHTDAPEGAEAVPVAPLGSPAKPQAVATAPTRPVQDTVEGARRLLEQAGLAKGLSYDRLVELVRGRFIPSQVVSATATNTFGMPAGSSVRDLTDEQRAELWDILLADAGEATPDSTKSSTTPSQPETGPASSPASTQTPTSATAGTSASTSARGRGQKG